MNGTYFIIDGDKVVRVQPTYNIWGDETGKCSDIVMDKETFIKCLEEWVGVINARR